MENLPLLGGGEGMGPPFRAHESKARIRNVIIGAAIVGALVVPVAFLHPCML